MSADEVQIAIDSAKKARQSLLDVERVILNIELAVHLGFEVTPNEIVGHLRMALNPTITMNIPHDHGTADAIEAKEIAE